jgi:hypothetical protein
MSPPSLVLGELDRFGRTGARLSRGELTEGAVRPGGVVVPRVLGQHLSQVVLTDDQQSVEEFPAQGHEHAFRVLGIVSLSIPYAPSCDQPLTESRTNETKSS